MSRALLIALVALMCYVSPASASEPVSDATATVYPIRDASVRSAARETASRVGRMSRWDANGAVRSYPLVSRAIDDLGQQWVKISLRSGRAGWVLQQDLSTRPLVRPRKDLLAGCKSRSSGSTSNGRLSGGVAFPVRGDGWVTYDWRTRRNDNPSGNRRASCRMARALLAIVREYHAANPSAPPLVIGDISRVGGGRFHGHSSHQRGADVDVYWPRKDGVLKPGTPAQIDRHLAQSLVNIMLRHNPTYIFVGPRVRPSGPSKIVKPWPKHDDHAHYRLGG